MTKSTHTHSKPHARVFTRTQETQATRTVQYGVNKQQDTARGGAGHTPLVAARSLAVHAREIVVSSVEGGGGGLHGVAKLASRVHVSIVL